MAVDGRTGGHDPPRSSGELPGRYGHRLLPACCPDRIGAPTFATQYPSAGWSGPSYLSWRSSDLASVGSWPLLMTAHGEVVPVSVEVEVAVPA